MEALIRLAELPADTKGKIANEYGSISKLYTKVYELEMENYNLHMTKPNRYQARQEEIENAMVDIEDKLDTFGIDGHDIVTDISSDFSEVIANKGVKLTDDYLKQLGTSFEEMREWLRKQLGE